jgi:hypothetical protein
MMWKLWSAEGALCTICNHRETHRERERERERERKGAFDEAVVALHR